MAQKIVHKFVVDKRALTLIKTDPDNVSLADILGAPAGQVMCDH